MVALAALVGLWLFRRELRRSGLPLDATDAGLVGVIGGLVGAKLLWTVEHATEAPLLELLLSRGGLSWYGGLIGGVGIGLAYIAFKRWPIVPILAAATPALAFGHLIGRIGCFLVGDDYGTPSTLPWAVAFPDGLPPTTVPVHPTQLDRGDRARTARMGTIQCGDAAYLMRRFWDGTSSQLARCDSARIPASQ